LLVAACKPPGRDASVTTATLREVTLPDLSRMDPSVQDQVKRRYQALLETLRRPGVADAERGAAYGGMGMVLHASEHYEAAEPAYLNAQMLMPREARWPYFIGHLRQSMGDTAGSIAAFSRALEIQPDDVTTLIWLGRAYLDQGRTDMAEPFFERARQRSPQMPAALVGLGQAALARRDFKRAVSVLEEALQIDPALASVHSPLAMAYRGLGDTVKAEAHLKDWRNTEVPVPDPWRQELDLALQSGLSFELRGVRALEQRDFTAAADFFSQGVMMTSGSTALGRSLRHKLGTAMYLRGDVKGAVKWFRETVKLAPPDGIDESAAKAHYSLGVLMASAGRGNEAIAHLTAAVRFSPTYAEAYQALGDALRRAGRAQQSMERYADAIRVNPKAADARFGYGMALVRLGRYREARDWFTEAAQLHPNNPDIPHALARVLAAAPDDGVRDGARAQALVEQLLVTDKTISLGETLAMAVAERGQFARAVQIQRDVIEANRQAGMTAATHLAANLQRYQQGRPCRTPWAADDPVHAPGPPVDPALVAALSAS
jgi:tetratricopeptide (TPR) repeat protein